MGKKVPIAVENIAFERLDLSRHYLTVDCDTTCFLVLNPSGEIPLEGTDICALHTGAWQIDAWALLTKKDFPNQAGFVACLVWDRTLISDSVHAPQCVESDIDTANSVSSLKGQPVNITGFSMASGEFLPTALVLGAYDGAVSVSNPLPVTNYAFYLDVSVGDVVDLDLLKSIAYLVVDEGVSIRCDCNPKRLYGTSPTHWLHLYDDRLTDFAAGPGNTDCAKYLCCMPFIVGFHVRKEDTTLIQIGTSVQGSAMYTNVGPVTAIGPDLQHITIWEM